eukprot:scaffold68861_cov20-Prasinocladus_malaysianus.AAC.1
MHRKSTRFRYIRPQTISVEARSETSEIQSIETRMRAASQKLNSRDEDGLPQSKSDHGQTIRDDI